MIIRPIEPEDYFKGYLNVVNVFTRHPVSVPFEHFKEHLEKAINQNAIILVAELDGTIVGTVKILVEYKLHNNLAKMAHIEDVAVHSNYRHQYIGRQLLTKALDYTTDCYKVVLSCKQDLIPFYNSHNFNQSGTTLSLYNLTSFSVNPST